MATLAVVVPATDHPASLERCVAALRASTEPADELVVVTEPPRAGPAAARNAGAAQTSSELIAFVDADVEVHPEALALARRAFDDQPGLAAVFGSYDDDPAAADPVSRFRNLLHHHVHSSSPGPARTFWAGLGVVRRGAFEAAGGFDAERYPEPSIEDIELGMRLVGAGGPIVLDPRLLGKHLKRWSIASMIRTDFARRGVPWVRLQLERGGSWDALNLGLRHRASALLALAVVAAALRRRPAAATGALAGLAALNAPFYALLYRRGGSALVAAGLPLHVVHHLVSVAAAAAGAALYTADRGASRSAATPAATAPWAATTSSPAAAPSANPRRTSAP
jgi:GT2 family glycosyltransferase